MKRIDRELLAVYRRLSPRHQASLLDFARFLESTQPDSADNVAWESPLDIPRPEKESVVAAIRRLSATYPMLETSTVLDDVSRLMSQHLLNGRGADEVIDDLEAMFKQRYAQRGVSADQHE